MTAGIEMGHEPIAPGSPLARALDDYPVPLLSTGFADRVLSAAQTRAAPLPTSRSARRGWGWRLGRGLAIGAAGFSVLASAAAATGLLERYNLPVPSAAQVWASVTGGVVPAATPMKAPPPGPSSDIAIAEADPAPVAIDGPIDTPEELAEAFRRIDAVRQGRIEARRALTEQKIAAALARRSAEGLPVPSAEEEARLRQRIAASQARRQQLAEERIRTRRTELARKVESGEALTREDFARPISDDILTPETLAALRQMSPEQRRDAFRSLPPAQRRALMEQWRQQRAARSELGNQAPKTGDPASPLPEALPEVDAGNALVPLPPQS